MCYSAQVTQVVRKFQRELGVQLDYDEAEKLFLRRLEDPSIVISRGFEANFEVPASAAGQRIAEAIERYRARASSRIEKDLFTQKTRLVGAQRALQSKDTKKAREDVRIASHKIESLSARLSDLRRTEPTPRDNRIFPNVYAGVIIRQGGMNVLTPMRYHCRPVGKPASYDKQFPGLYNARRDNLERFWKEQFGHTHALMVVESFYENVAQHVMEHRSLRADEPERNVVLHFTPQPPQAMLVACLYSHWQAAGAADVRGFAAITDEPPAEVAAAGHDRCIIHIAPRNVEAWLTPEGRGLSQLQAILSERPPLRFEHEALRAA
jgi:putative SOS response-associated peptidase YedK